METRIRRARWVIGIAFGVTIGVYLLNFGLANQQPLSNSQDHWSQFGDFVGGLLNPLVAFFAFYWLTESVRIQKQELSATREALQNASQDAARNRRADRFASLYDEVNASAFGESMETIGLWLDATAREAGTRRDLLTSTAVEKAYRDFAAGQQRQGLNTKKHPLERARRSVKSWYIKCFLFFEADELEERHLFALITRDRADLMLQVFSMTRGQTSAWKTASGSTEKLASSDAIYFDPLDKLVSAKYGSFAASTKVDTQ